MNISDFQVEVIIPTQTKYLDLIGSIGEHIGKGLENFSGDKKALAYHLNLVLTEATSNAIKHSKTKNIKDTVKINIQVFDDELLIKVYDHGQGFDLQSVPLAVEGLAESGRGIFFIREF